MPDSFPLVCGTPEQSARVRAFLEAAGYAEAPLCARFEVVRLENLIGGFNRKGKMLERGLRSNDVVSFLVRLFLAGVAVPESEYRAWIPDLVREALEYMGLAAPYEAKPGYVYAPVLLYPSGRVYLASDRYVGPDGAPYYDQADVVMLAISKVSQDFLDMMPRTPCERFLELGAGAGAGALNAAFFAGESWATDITRRSVDFAEFSRRLNGLENVKMVQGDLFAPVEGIQFDRICTNPPFEPPVKQNYIFSVGGSDGEQIVRRILESLHTVLSPGGRLYVITLGSDREGDPFEQRLRRYMGPHADEYDLALFLRDELKPMEYSMEATLGEREGFDKMAEWGDFWASLKAQKVLYGHFVVQRKASDRAVFTVRRTFGPATGIRQAEWLLDWMTRAMEGGTARLLLESKPKAPHHIELRVRHAFREGKLLPTDYTLWTDRPFQTDLYCPGWLAKLAASCDGERTGAELFGHFREQGFLGRDNPEGRFLEALGALAAGGFVHIPGCEPPE